MKTAITLKIHCIMKEELSISPPLIATAINMACWHVLRWRPDLIGSTMSPNLTSTAASNQVGLRLYISVYLQYNI